MESKENRQDWYLIADRQQVAVSQKVYRMIRKDNNRIRTQAKAEESCAQTDYSACRGDCLTCPWHTQGILEGITEVELACDVRFFSTANTEETALNRMTLQAVYAQADVVVKQGALLLQLYFEHGCTYREIAERMGVSHVMIIKRMDTLLTYLRSHKKLFF